LSNKKRALKRNKSALPSPTAKMCSHHAAK
jgi:hypothetical protein